MWFLGNASSPAIRTAMRHGELGMIITPAEGRAPLEGVVFGADNSCCGAGYPGDQRWLSWLAQWTPLVDRCLWATAPDVLGDAAATAWKLGSATAALVAEAHRRRKPVHMGRVNSQKRWRYATNLGCVSVDGTCLTFAPDLNLERVRSWIGSTTPTLASTPPPPTAHRGDQLAVSIVPVTFRQAREFIRDHHRHRRPPQGMRFAIGVTANQKLVGVAIIDRPIAHYLDDKATLEITRSCTAGTRNANSMLYAAALRITRELGYWRLFTYTQDGESGASLRAAGFQPTVHRRAHRGWNRPSRPRTDPVRPVARTRWELTLATRTQAPSHCPIETKRRRPRDRRPATTRHADQ